MGTAREHDGVVYRRRGSVARQQDGVSTDLRFRRALERSCITRARPTSGGAMLRVERPDRRLSYVDWPTSSRNPRPSSPARSTRELPACRSRSGRRRSSRRRAGRLPCRRRNRRPTGSPRAVRPVAVSAVKHDVRRGLAREAVGALHVIEIAEQAELLEDGARGRSALGGRGGLASAERRQRLRDARDRRCVSVWPRPR